MADIGEDFDAETTEPTVGFDLIPAGEYEAMIIESEKKDTNAKDGQYIALTFQILGPTHAGRNLWHNLNLWNKNPQAVQISRGNLSAIGRAVGVLKIRETSQLHNLPMLIRVGQKRRKDNGEMQNVINTWKPKDGMAVPPASTGVPPAAPAASVSAGGKPAAPWGAKKATG